MRRNKIITTVSADKLVNPWGGDEKVKEEVKRALENYCENPNLIICKKCGSRYQPKPFQFIFYNLCETCFVEFDTQKMNGRRSWLQNPSKPFTHFEDADEWIAASKK